MPSPLLLLLLLLLLPSLPPPPPPPTLLLLLLLLGTVQSTVLREAGEAVKCCLETSGTAASSHQQGGSLPAHPVACRVTERHLALRRQDLKG
jgi:hypothetical protein